MVTAKDDDLLGVSNPILTTTDRNHL